MTPQGAPWLTASATTIIAPAAATTTSWTSEPPTAAESTSKGHTPRQNHPDAPDGPPRFGLTLDEYWALPEPAQSQTSLLQNGGWTRPNRFISDGSDICFVNLQPENA
jgi:hypothetical protein